MKMRRYWFESNETFDWKPLDLSLFHLSENNVKWLILKKMRWWFELVYKMKLTVAFFPSISMLLIPSLILLQHFSTSPSWPTDRCFIISWLWWLWCYCWMTRMGETSQEKVLENFEKKNFQTFFSSCHLLIFLNMRASPY